AWLGAVRRAGGWGVLAGVTGRFWPGPSVRRAEHELEPIVLARSGAKLAQGAFATEPRHDGPLARFDEKLGWQSCGGTGALAVDQDLRLAVGHVEREARDFFPHQVEQALGLLLLLGIAAGWVVLECVRDVLSRLGVFTQ